MTLIASSDIVLHDSSYDAAAPYLYDLLVLCGESSVSVAVYRASEKLFLALEQFNIPVEEQQVDFYTAVFSRSALLSGKGFRKAVFASAFRNSTLVPNPLYTPGTAETHLHFSTATNGQSHVLTDEMRQVDARNVHAIPEWLHRLINQQFPGAVMVHSSSAVIDHLTTLFKNTGEELIWVDVQPGTISMVITRGKKLLLSNSFTYENAEGLVYFILFACEQLQLNPESINLRFTGILDAEDAAYKLALKYVRNTDFLEKSELFQYAGELETLPGHRHFSLFIQATCVS
jgi:hypothetical protein